MNEVVLSTTNLKKFYGKNDTLTKALNDVNLTVERGEFLAVCTLSEYLTKTTLTHELQSA